MAQTQAVAVSGIPINVDPTLIAIGPLLITWHGLFTAVGTLLGVWLAVRWATRAGYTEDQTISVAMWGIVGAILGARLFHVVDQWNFYAANPLQIVKLNEGGLAIFGAIVGGPLAGALYARRSGIPIPRLLDVATPCLILGMGIGRIGDIINGEHRGVPAPGFPLAVTYTHPNTLGQIGEAVHLAVGYELVVDLLIFALMVWLARGITRAPGGGLRFDWQPRYGRDGMLFWVALGLYSVGRFFIEFYRQDTIFALGISQSQLLSVLSAIVSVWALVYMAARRGTRSRREPERAHASSASP